MNFFLKSHKHKKLFPVLSGIVFAIVRNDKKYYLRRPN